MCIRDSSQIARNIFQGNLAWFYPVIQFVTTAILILAANTAYQDFPRLSSILARDRFAPVSYTHLDVYKRQDGDPGSVCIQ